MTIVKIYYFFVYSIESGLAISEDNLLSF